MRHLWTIVAVAALWGSLGSIGLAEDPTAKAPSDNKVAARADADSVQLRAAIHRTMADLLEAQAAEKPDPAKVDALTRKIIELRGKLQAQPAVAEGVAPAWGRPAMAVGRGAGWGGGRGAGFGGGRGGAGFGQGLGPGGGQGRGFVDADNDGICDYYELTHGLHK